MNYKPTTSETDLWTELGYQSRAHLTPMKEIPTNWLDDQVSALAEIETTLNETQQAALIWKIYDLTHAHHTAHRGTHNL